MLPRIDIIREKNETEGPIFWVLVIGAKPEKNIIRMEELRDKYGDLNFKIIYCSTVNATSHKERDTKMSIGLSIDYPDNFLCMDVFLLPNYLSNFFDMILLDVSVFDQLMLSRMINSINVDGLNILISLLRKPNGILYLQPIGSGYRTQRATNSYGDKLNRIDTFNIESELLPCISYHDYMPEDDQNIQTMRINYNDWFLKYMNPNIKMKMKVIQPFEYFPYGVYLIIQPGDLSGGQSKSKGTKNKKQKTKNKNKKQKQKTKNKKQKKSFKT